MNGRVKEDTGASNGHSVPLSADEGGAFGVGYANGNSVLPSSAHARGGNMEDITVPLNDVPAFTPSKRLKVAIVGAGHSGLIMAHKPMYQHAKDTEKILDFTIYEAKDVPGGTWVNNTYPGGISLRPKSKLDSFLFEWSRDYRIHSQDCQEMEFSSQRTVTSTQWSEEKSHGRVQVSHKGEERDEYADILISARGFLSTWYWPEIPGIDTFKGLKVHSAAWDHSYDYSGERIGVIGNGSCGIQILPAMAKLPNTQVTSLQRGPTWIFSRMTSADLVGSSDKSYNHVYREKDEQRFQDPEEMKRYRKKAQGGVNKAYHMLVKGSPANMSATIFAEKQMSEKLNHDPVLCEKLIPKWELGCRRITPGDGYLESSTQPNVNLTNSPITSIEATGIRTAGNTLHELDVIIFLTGFDVSQIPPYPVIGLNNMTLAEKWNQEPESYLSVACPEFPNYSIFTGPNATVTGPSFKVYHGQVIILSFGSSERISLPLSQNKRLLTNLFGMEIRCIRR